MVHWREPRDYGEAVCHFCCPQVRRKTRRSMSNYEPGKNSSFIFFSPIESLVWAAPGLYLWTKRPRRSFPFGLGKSECLTVSRGTQNGILVFSLLGRPLLERASWGRRADKGCQVRIAHFEGFQRSQRKDVYLNIVTNITSSRLTQLSLHASPPAKVIFPNLVLFNLCQILG